MFLKRSKTANEKRDLMRTFAERSVLAGYSFSVNGTSVEICNPVSEICKLAHCKVYREYPARCIYSLYSVCCSSDAAICWQYCSKLLVLEWWIQFLS